MIGRTRFSRRSAQVALWLGAFWQRPSAHVRAFDDPPVVPAPVLVPPARIAGEDPSYPEAALALTPVPSGTVRLRLSVNEQGEVTDVEIVSSPATPLSDAALGAARAWRFQPATRDQQPVAARILYELAFSPPAAAAASAGPPPTGSRPEAADPGAPPSAATPGNSAAETGAASALPPPAAEEVLELDSPRWRAGKPVVADVVVTGSRAPEELNQAVVFTDVVGRRAIRESGARDAGEALEHIPSLQLVRSFRGTEIWLRGLDPEYTLVLLDGDRLIGRSGGAVDLTRIGVERIDRIEIVRGPASALYGSDALAGVVNIIGQQATGKAHGRALVQGGFTPRTDSPMGDATVWATQPVARGLDVQASAGVHTAPEVKDGDSDISDLSERKQWSLFGAGRYQPSESHDIKLSGEYDQQRLSGVDTGAGGALYDRTQLREQGVFGLSYRMRPSKAVDWSTRYRGSFFREQYARDQRGSAAMDSVEDSRERLHQVTSMLTWQPETAHALTLGAEQQLQHLRAPRLTRDGDRSVTSVFAQHRLRPWTVEHAERVECDQQLSIVPGARLDVDSQYGTQLSPKLAVRYDPAPCLTLRAAYGRGFRAPSFQQLFLRFENPTVGYIVMGNPNLGAERSHGFDLSASYTPLPGVTGFVALFRNDVRDMITTVTGADNASGTLFTYGNIASAWTMGAELNVHLELSSWLTSDLSYTYTYGRNAELDRPLEAVARHRPTAMVRVQHPSWKTALRFRGSMLLGRVFYGDTADTLTDSADEQRIDAPALVTGDIRVEQALGDYLDAFIGIDNLASASDTYTTLRPRTYYAGLSGHY
jgi:outer membrane receptor for ferrienterochelin and colicins